MQIGIDSFSKVYTEGTLAERRWPDRCRRPLAGAIPLAFLLSIALGCGTTPLASVEGRPGDIPSLESQVESRPDDGALLIRLGAAYHAAGRPTEAVDPLERATSLAPAAPEPVLLLGLAYEDLARWTEARELYRRYLSLAPGSPAASQIRGRMRLAERREIEALVRRAVAQEHELSQTPSPTTLAVFPFRFTGGNEELAPLGHALAGMLTTDLSEGSRFQLLERTHLDALMSEIALADEGLVDPQTAARSGRILGAGRILQGWFGGSEEQFELEAAVVEVRAADSRVRPVEVQEGLSRFFEMEKALVFELFETMGVTLTEAERERILGRRTDNLQALLEYGRGMEASQRGDYAGAAEHFRRASQIDPSFEMARAEAVEAEQIAAAAETTTAELLAQVTQPLEVPELIDPAELVEAVVRDPAQEVLGTETIQSGVILDIVIRRPGGAQ